MSTYPNESILDVLLEWEERRESTPNVTLAEVCRDSDLCVEVQRYAATINSVEQILACVPSESRPAVEIAPFEMLEQLGEGGMGEVYLARDPALNRKVAVKIPKLGLVENPNLRQRFLREARLLATLNHPNIVSIYTAGLVGNQSHLVMEYVSGGSLAHHKPKALKNADWVVAILEQIARAVDYAHQRGILHRDLKPSNILIDETGQPKVADFGVAALFSGEPVQMLAPETPNGSAANTATSTRGAGTPAYTAPELRQRERGTLSPQADVWSLGVVAYEMLTGQLPYTDSTIVPNAPPPRLRTIQPHVPRSLDRLVMRCLNPQPAQRPATAGKLAQSFSRWRKRQRWTRWTKRYVLPVLLTLGLFAGIGALSLPPSPEAVRERIQRDIQAQLRAGKSVTLIGEKQTPKGYRTAFGEAYAETTVHPDGSLSVSAPRPAAVELADNVLDRFRMTAEIREEGFFGEAFVGFYFGHRPLEGDGKPLHALCCLHFADFGPRARQAKDPDEPLSNVALKWYVFPDAVTTGKDWMSFGYCTRNYIPPAGNTPAPGPWRTIRVDVTPEHVTAFFEGEQVGEPFALKEAQDWAMRRITSDPRFAGKSFQPSHVGGAGLFVHGGEVRCRHFQIEPLPPIEAKSP